MGGHLSRFAVGEEPQVLRVRGADHPLSCRTSPRKGEISSFNPVPNPIGMKRVVCVRCFTHLIAEADEATGGRAMTIHSIGSKAAVRSAEARVAGYDWQALAEEMSGYGCAVMEKLLTPQECREIAGLYPDESHFRSHVHMAQFALSKGEYRYFRYPLPELIGGLRTTLPPRLAAVANDWNERMGIAQRYPDEHAAFLTQCHDQGQTRPTPLLLQYIAGNFNCLHQDLYGDLAFPLQVAILLSEPDKDFTGGKFVLTEQRPRMQSRAEVVPLRQGDAVAFAVYNRPVQGSKGSYRVNLRHGVEPASLRPAPHHRRRLPRREVKVL